MFYVLLALRAELRAVVGAGLLFGVARSGLMAPGEDARLAGWLAAPGPHAPDLLWAGNEVAVTLPSGEGRIDRLVQRRDARDLSSLRRRTREDGSAAGGFEVTTHGGRTRTGLDAIEWCARAAELGAGEILLNSMDADGTKDGFDLPLLRAVRERVHIPVVASGGVTTLDDVRALRELEADRLVERRGPEARPLYALTADGAALARLLSDLASWEGGRAP